MASSRRACTCVCSSQGILLPIARRPILIMLYRYDTNMVIALVRAAELARSPAIIQMFPVTLAFGKGPWLQFCLNA